ncbi:MAG: hypothetical protein ACKV19_12160 [Verrucomicrobiales bacterium]
MPAIRPDCAIRQRTRRKSWAEAASDKESETPTLSNRMPEMFGRRPNGCPGLLTFQPETVEFFLRLDDERTLVLDPS